MAKNDAFSFQQYYTCIFKIKALTNLKICYPSGDGL